MSTMHDVSKLDDLIVTTIDSIKGYEQAAGHADAADLVAFFRDMAADRSTMVAALQAESRRLGGTPNEFGSVAGSIHRRWEDLRRVLGGGDQSIISEVARGEAYLQEEFDRVLADKHMSPEALAVVEGAYQSVVRGIARAEALKQAVPA